MSRETVHLRTSRAVIRKALRNLPREIKDDRAVIDAIMTRVGMTVLGRIREAFIVKARGGTDEAGERWRPLLPATIAGRRRGRKRRGTESVEILRDTGLLLNSLSPGVSSPENIFRVERGAAVIGTNRKGAVYHHTGAKNLPQRRLWPPVSKWPRSWWKDNEEQMKQGLIDVTLEMIRRSR